MKFMVCYITHSASSRIAQGNSIKNRKGVDRGMNSQTIGYSGPEGLSFSFGTQIQLEFSGMTERFESELLGVVYKKCLMVKTPVSPSRDIFMNLLRGNKVIVRYIHQGTIFGFQSNLEGSILVPIKMLFIAYPNHVEKRSLRNSPRFECFLPAEIRCDDISVIGVILDISEKGCRFSAKSTEGDSANELAPESSCILTFQLPGTAEPQEVSTTVRNNRKEIQGRHLGLEFIDIPEDVRGNIGNYISAIED